ncbi:MAG: flavodoxin-dependent (E)-4-hydroxy-3-methylbut-2-enyl-diphosphate synthase, partial [Halanaerobiales bacterium]
IHFDHQLALEAARHKVDGIRINPGNIGKQKNIIQVIRAVKKTGIPLRIGVNAGSLEKSLLKKYGHPSPEALVESALNQVQILGENDFYNTVISIKASDIWKTIEAHQLLAKKVDYPFHVGITEAGRPGKGSIKSAAGLGALLTRGFGDTLRVSLTGSPLEEVKVGWQILESLGLRQRGPQIISCPTCGRTEIDLISLAAEVEEALKECNRNITVAVMGCAVNGPGEAREADIGIAGGKQEGLIFKNGKLIKKVKENKLVAALLKEINNL